MKHIKRYIILALLVIVIAASIITAINFSNFLKPGVHRFAGYTRLDFSQPVYFIDADTNEVFGNSTFTIYGLVQPKKENSSSFRGCMGITQYAIALENCYSDYFGIVGDGSIHIVSHNRSDGQAYYWLRMSQDDPAIYAVFIYLEDGSSLTAYPGGTEEEALANCQRFWQWFRT